jgi:hypothetical protein
MPETTMYEYRPPVCVIGQIGLSWKAINMRSEPEPQSMDGGARQDFWFRIA